MDILNQFLGMYEELVSDDLEGKGKLKGSTITAGKRTLNVSKGSVFESYSTSLPFLFVVVSEKEDTLLIALMSDFWELATNKDIFVSLSHPVRETWIVETDITCEIPKSFIQNFLPAGKLKGDDFELVRKAINGENIPINKRGKGYNDPIHERFKHLERERFQSIFPRFIKKEEKKNCIVIKFFPQMMNLLEPMERKLLVASSEDRSIETDKFQSIFNPEEGKITILFKEPVYGKPGKVSLNLGSINVMLHKGIIKDLEITDADRNLFNLLRYLNIEVKCD